jgi:hypothetical protein
MIPQTKHHFTITEDGKQTHIAVICKWSSFRTGIDSEVNFFFGAASRAAYDAASHRAGDAHMAMGNSYYLPCAETTHAKQADEVTNVTC